MNTYYWRSFDNLIVSKANIVDSLVIKNNTTSIIKKAKSRIWVKLSAITIINKVTMSIPI